MANPVSTALSKLPWYGQIGVFIVLSGILAGVFYYYVETPAQEALAVQRTELQGIQQRISAGTAAARRLPEFRKEIQELEARLDVLKPILPTDRDAGDLLRRVQTLAVQSNLTILGFRPQPITVNDMHAEWPIGLQLEGNYHNLGLFLDKVSKFPRIINVGGINLAAKNPPEAQASMNIGLTATTFVLIDTAPAPAAAPAKGPAKK
ncbi:MAG TPA: type 4a pilus biogenesis protein PilO [Dongiaceae bacterium]